jgi:hypothetical protein
VKDKISASTQDQALNAIAFLYRQVLKREMGELRAKGFGVGLLQIVPIQKQQRRIK